MITTLLILLTFVLAAVQTRLPTLWWAGGLRLEFLPAVVAYAAVSLRRGHALTVAAVAGLAQDALSAAPFGITAVAFVLGSLAVSWLRDLLERDLPWMQMAVGAWLAAISAAGACLARAFTVGAFGKIIVLAMISAVITPAMFVGLDLLPVRRRGK